MALLSLSDNLPPILCPNLRRNHASQGPFSSKTSISKTPNLGISRISISSAKLVDTFVREAKCCSSLSSLGELDKGASSTAIVFIKGLSKATSKGVLKVAFSQFGEVSRVKIISDKKTYQSLGFAYVWFTKEEHAQAAVDGMNGQFFDGRFIHVALAKPGSCKPRPKPSPYKF